MIFSTAIKRAKALIEKDILALMVGLGLCVLTLTASQLAWSRHQVFRAEQRQAQALARSLAEHAYDTVKAADSVLQGMVERVRIEGTDTAAIARLEKILAMHVADDARFHAFTLVDSHGDMIASSLGDQRVQVNVFNREYFAATRDAAMTDGPNISSPVLSRSDNTWVISISRAIRRDDGSFVGIITCAISVDMLQKLYDSVDVGQHGAIQLNNSRGILLVRRPFNLASVGENYFYGQMFQSALGPQIETPLDFISRIDQRHRIGTSVKIPRYHLQLAVSFDEAEMLADWWQQAQLELATLAVMFLCAAIGYRMYTKQANMRAASDARYRLLAEYSYDVIVVLNTEMIREYVSPSFYALTGWTPELLEGKGYQAYIYADDVPPTFEAFRACVSGEDPGPIKFRYILPDGQLKWMEMVTRLAPSSSSSDHKFICSHRDITLRMQAEEALAAANAELSTLMLTDPLTGIANRRQFDQRLDQAWSQSMRNHAPMALMMIDVDRFKAYNDHYGHVEGDQCLRAVAQLLKATTRRAADVVARYGGEEFSIIMPNTSEQEAMEIAERLISEISAAAIPHEKSEFQIITISIGIAVMTPERDSDYTPLVQMADKAVYEAKRRGRHQIVLAPPQQGQLRLVVH